MSEDPKSDLMRKSGPLGSLSPVSPAQAAKADDAQAAIMYQNDEQLKAIWRLEGSVDTGFKGAHARMDKFDGRLNLLEQFNDRVIMVPKMVWGLLTLLGGSSVISALGWIGHLFGWK